MTVFLLSFLVMALAILGMGLGVLLGRPPLTGGCGSTGEAGGEKCRACPERRRLGTSGS